MSFNVIKIFYVCVVFATLPIATRQQQQITNKLLVKVFYETLCSDSITFFTNQLQPSMRSNNRLQYTDLKLIPFGKAYVYRNGNFLVVQCQHGDEECEKNALHACILENAPSDIVVFDVIACLMRSATTNFEQCANYYNLNVEPVNTCKHGRSNAEILEKYATETAAIALTFVPSISVNNIFDYYQQNDLFYQFDSNFCRIYAEQFGQHLAGCTTKTKIRPVTRQYTWWSRNPWCLVC